MLFSGKLILLFFNRLIHGLNYCPLNLPAHIDLTKLTATYMMTQCIKKKKKTVLKDAKMMVGLIKVTD